MPMATTSKMDGTKRILNGNFITHFFVTVVQTGKDTFKDCPEIWKNESSRCWGYTDTFEKAERAILDNYSDIHECSYQWAVIEEHVMDVFAIGTGIFQWYHWSKTKRGYKRCKQPDWAKQVCHWGIG